MRSRPAGPRALSLILLFGVFSAVSTLGVADAQDAVTLEEYRARVAAALDAAQEGVVAPSPSAMRSVRTSLGVPATVEIAPGHLVLVPMPTALSGLSGESTRDFDRAATELGAMLAAADRALATRQLSDDELRALITNAYRGVGAAQPGIGERIRRALDEVLAWLLDRLFNARGFGAIVAWALVAAILIGFVWLLRRGTVPERAPPHGQLEHDADVDWEQVAEEALRRGDLDTAVRASFRALVRELSAQGFLLDEPSVTAGECRTATAARRPSAMPSVSRGTVAFERVAYGNAAPATRDFELLRAALDEVRR